MSDRFERVILNLGYQTAHLTQVDTYQLNDDQEIVGFTSKRQMLNSPIHQFEFIIAQVQ